MSRTFQTHPLRSRIELNGLWQFHACPANTDVARLSVPPALDDCRDRLPVPGVWEASLTHYRHRGYGWYVRTFNVPPAAAGATRLVFEAVSHTATVWLDGRYLGSHYGAHTEFTFVLPELAAGEHVLAVLVDNRFGDHNPLTTARQDIYTWGGISRPVFLEQLPDVYIADATVVPAAVDGDWQVKIAIQLAQIHRGQWPETARVTIGTECAATVSIDEKGQGNATISIGKPALWSPERPNLYHVEIIAGPDTWRERIGFRTIEVCGRKLLLNGKPWWLRGVNRHEFHPDFGPALPPALQLRDLEILKQLGANFVRGSHYPNDPIFLDLCDEHGIVFWEELAHWQPGKAEMENPAFLSASLAQADEMVHQHRHHPCIILWGMLNEADFRQPAAREITAALASRFRALDPTRLVTCAFDKPGANHCFDLVDVIGLNFYPGWYLSDLPEAARAAREWIEQISRHGGEKPLLISEFGAAGIDGARSIEDRKWTENFQARLIEDIITTADCGNPCSRNGQSECRDCHALVSQARNDKQYVVRNAVRWSALSLTRCGEAAAR